MSRTYEVIIRTKPISQRPQLATRVVCGLDYHGQPYIVHALSPCERRSDRDDTRPRAWFTEEWTTIDAAPNFL